jgi:hypothetical protein
MVCATRIRSSSSGRVRNQSRVIFPSTRSTGARIHSLTNSPNNSPTAAQTLGDIATNRPGHRSLAGGAALLALRGNGQHTNRLSGLGAVGGRTLLTARCFGTPGAGLSLIEGGEVRNVRRRTRRHPRLSPGRGSGQQHCRSATPSIVESTTGSRRSRGNELKPPDPLIKHDQSEVRVVIADDEVTVPVPGLRTVLRGERAIVDGEHWMLNPGPSSLLTLMCSAVVTAGA